MGLQLSHKEARSLFLPFADEELPKERAAKLRSHLDGCGDCRQGFDQYLKTVQALRAMPRERGPDALATQILRRVRTKSRPWNPQRQVASAAAHRVPAEVALWILVLAAAMLLAVYV